MPKMYFTHCLLLTMCGNYSNERLHPWKKFLKQNLYHYILLKAIGFMTHALVGKLVAILALAACDTDTVIGPFKVLYIVLLEAILQFFSYYCVGIA